MKHGPIALIDQSLPVVVLAPRGPGYEKMLSNVEEVRARGGQVYAVVTKGDEQISRNADGFTPSRMLAAARDHPGSVPLQLLAYHVAVVRGTDVDQPRNLAKSVTVE